MMTEKSTSILENHVKVLDRVSVSGCGPATVPSVVGILVVN